MTQTFEINIHYTTKLYNETNVFQIVSKSSNDFKRLLVAQIKENNKIYDFDITSPNKKISYKISVDKVYKSENTKQINLDNTYSAIEFSNNKYLFKEGYNCFRYFANTFACYVKIHDDEIIQSFKICGDIMHPYTDILLIYTNKNVYLLGVGIYVPIEKFNQFIEGDLDIMQFTFRINDYYMLWDSRNLP